MATVNTQLTPDDLYRLVGLLADGRDPLAALLPDEEQRYVALGQAVGEAVALRLRVSILDAQIIAARRQPPASPARPTPRHAVEPGRDDDPAPLAGPADEGG